MQKSPREGLSAVGTVLGSPFLLAALLCVLALGAAGCGRSADPEEESVRVVLPVRHEGEPSARIEEIFAEVDNYVQAHPDDFGGASMNYDFSAVLVWTAQDAAWDSPEFTELRNKIDPEGEVVAHLGEGASLTYLNDLRDQISAQYGQNDRISEIAVDPMLNAVRVKIRYDPFLPSLDALPLAEDISAIAPEVVIQSDGSPNVAA